MTIEEYTVDELLFMPNTLEKHSFILSTVWSIVYIIVIIIIVVVIVRVEYFIVAY